MAATRRKTAKKKTKRTAAEQRAGKELTAILLFALGVLLFCLAAVPGADAWRTVHAAFRGILGWCAFLPGPMLVTVAVLMALEKGRPRPALKIVSAVILILLLSGLTEILLLKEAPADGFREVWTRLYADGRALRGGGAFAMAFGLPLLRWLGFAGSLIVTLLAVFIFFMLAMGLTLRKLFSGAVSPVRKIGEAYTSAVAEREALEAERPVRTERRNFDIDVPLDDPSRRRWKRILEDEADASRRRIGRAVRTLKTPERGSRGGKAYDFDAEPDGPARPGRADPVPAAEPEPTLDDLITRAVTGTAVVGETPLPETPDGRLRFGGPPVPEPDAGAAAPGYVFPPVSLLQESRPGGKSRDTGKELKNTADLLVETLRNFGVESRIVHISRGPTVTRYELQPSPGVKISRITSLADDIAMNLAAGGVRMEAPIPNKAAIGIEVPNREIRAVPIRELIDSDPFRDAESLLNVALGRDIAGNFCFADLAEMPHLLIAGATGSGKSVCINSIIVSLLYKAGPEDIKLLMIDPKVVELGVYNGIPHLLVPVVTDARKAAGALCWAVGEMLNRYKLFGSTSTRDIRGYNRAAERQGGRKMPHMVIIVDELADLMLAAPREVEDCINRLAAMARAAGIHLVVATQRPSTDVITGTIKANIPSRISFAVSSQVDSRVILDMNGAEKLLGRGDMLFFPVGAAKPTRIQGCLVTDQEIERVIGFIREGRDGFYDDRILTEIEKSAAGVKGRGAGAGGGPDDEVDELYRQAVEAVVEAGAASTSMLQRRLKLGYARAARLIDEMEARGIVGPLEGSRPRRILITKAQYYEKKALSGDEGV